MTTISFDAPHRVFIAPDRSFKAVLLVSCLGLCASICMVTLGVDLGAGWL
jgi:hypothetical protein